MTPLEFASYVRFKTNTNATTFTDTQILMLMNIFKDEMATEIIKADEDYFGTPETANLVAGQREYPFPDDQLNQVQHVEAKLDGSTWIPLSEFNLSGYNKATDEDTILATFGNTEGRAFFDIFRNSLFIYSGEITDVTAGLKIWSYQWPAKVTDLDEGSIDLSIDPSNTSIGFPRAFHELWARRVIIEYKTSGDRGMQLTENELKYSVDLRAKLDSIAGMNKGRVHVGQLPDSSNRGNNGFDY